MSIGQAKTAEQTLQCLKDGVRMGGWTPDKVFSRLKVTFFRRGKPEAMQDRIRDGFDHWRAHGIA